ASVLTDVIGRGHSDASSFCSRDSRTINSCAKSARVHAVYPGEDVRLLLGQHPATFFLIQEDECIFGESLAPGSSDSLGCVRGAQPPGIGNLFQVGIDTSVEQKQESKTGGFHGHTMTDPRVGGGAWRRIQPISRKCKSATQSRKVCVAGIFIAIKSQISSLGCVLVEPCWN